MVNKKEIQGVLKCVKALDMRYKEGLAVLENHGFDDSNRLGYPASKFVADKVSKLLKDLEQEGAF